MSRGILDTSVLIAIDVSPIPGELAISAISIAELQFGVLIAPERTRATRLNRLSAVQRRFDPLPVDDAVADSYALLAARVVAIGRQPRARVMDLLIAATAHAHNAVVYTRNPKDLAELEGLVVVEMADRARPNIWCADAPSCPESRDHGRPNAENHPRRPRPPTPPTARAALPSRA